MAPGTTRSITIGETGRTMLIHLPASYEGTSELPLFFVLHGSTGSRADILATSKLEETADRHGFILAAPDCGIISGKGFVCNIPGVPTVTGAIPGPEDADDVAFIKQSVEWLAAARCIDKSRVYMSGLSGGGRMTS